MSAAVLEGASQGTDSAVAASLPVHLEVCGEESDGGPPGGLSIKVFEVPWKAWWGAIVWDAGLLLAQVLCREAAELIDVVGKAGDGGTDVVVGSGRQSGHGPPGGLRVLELGTGTGFVGVAALRLLPHARAVLTDFSEPELALARRTAEANGVAGRLDALPLRWERVAAAEEEDSDATRGSRRGVESEGSKRDVQDGAAALGEPFDLLLGSDLVYTGTAVTELVATLHRFARPRNATIWIAGRHRPQGGKLVRAISDSSSNGGASGGSDASSWLLATVGHILAAMDATWVQIESTIPSLRRFLFSRGSAEVGTAALSRGGSDDDRDDGWRNFLETAKATFEEVEEVDWQAKLGAAGVRRLLATIAVRGSSELHDSAVPAWVLTTIFGYDATQRAQERLWLLRLKGVRRRKKVLEA